jgi:hypothetical protein
MSNCFPSAIQPLRRCCGIEESSYYTDYRFVSLAIGRKDVETSWVGAAGAVDSLEGSSGNVLVLNLDVGGAGCIATIPEAQASTRLDRDCYCESPGTKVSGANLRMCCSCRLAVLGNWRWETFPDRIHLVSLKLDSDRTWKSNSVASAAVQTWANPVESCMARNSSIRYLSWKRFRREEELADLCLNSIQRASRVSRLVGGTWRVDYQYVGDEVVDRAEHLCS